MRPWMARLGTCLAAAAWFALLVPMYSPLNVVPHRLCLPLAGASMMCGAAGWQHPSGKFAFVVGTGAGAIDLLIESLIYLTFSGLWLN
jgi:hypothetical protein